MGEEMSWKHLNDNIICAIDTETTGLLPGYHEIVSIAIIPLNMDFDPDPILRPFSCLIRPNYPERWDLEAARINGLREKCMTHGLAHDRAIGMFFDWFDSLGLRATGSPPYHKMIEPLAHNWGFDRSFINEWMGIDDEDGQYIADKYISRTFRDPRAIGPFLNDIAATKHQSAYPFPHHNLKQMCTKMGVKLYDHHDAMQDAYAVADLYKRLLRVTISCNKVDTRNEIASFQ
jgi:DNA polymerase III epsilon subunit-like protein